MANDHKFLFDLSAANHFPLSFFLVTSENGIQQKLQPKLWLSVKIPFKEFNQRNDNCTDFLQVLKHLSIFYKDILFSLHLR